MFSPNFLILTPSGRITEYVSTCLFTQGKNLFNPETSIDKEIIHRERVCSVHVKLGKNMFSRDLFRFTSWYSSLFLAGGLAGSFFPCFLLSHVTCLTWSVVKGTVYCAVSCDSVNWVVLSLFRQLWTPLLLMVKMTRQGIKQPRKRRKHRECLR